MSALHSHCPDCDGPQQQNRREFLRTTTCLGLAAAAGGAASWIPSIARAAEPPKSETLVARLYQSLDDKQKKSCLFPFDDQLRSRVDANWHITDTRIARDFNQDQQALIRDIFRGLHSEEYAAKVFQQVEHDGGFGNCSIALFGQPGSGAFEFVLTGAHVTRRCDGDSVQGAAFGGPVFYGHAAAGFNEPADHRGNAYWYQAQRANELFQAFDNKQRDLALRETPRVERGNDTVKFSTEPTQIQGLPVSEMSADQQELARRVMHDVLAPFRQVDREESMKMIEKNSFDKLHFSYYKNGDIGGDGVWDIWQIEGPAMVWFFRGSPHVHTWVHVRDSA